uniref:Uncharacterized protein n=1 Tax=Heterosigma akashiwo TaxID=2829 RepID=A0A7S4D7S8_HETAK
MHSVGSADQMIQEYSWSKVTPQGYRLTPRGGHSAVVADYQLIVFGGTSYDGGGKFSYLNDTCVLDVETMTWQLVRCGGNLPAPRYGHACELVGSRMFVLGGKGKGNGDGGGGCFRDVHALDLVDWVWVPINATSTGPSPRFNAASAAVGRKIVVHGGWDGEAACLGDLWVFDTDSFAWVQPRVGGLPPSPRYGHTLTLLPDGRLLALGGAAVPAPGAGAVAPQYLEDLRQLDTETMAWSKPARAGEKLSGRFGHTTTLLDSSALFIFGGWGLGGLQEKATNNRDGAHSVCAIGIEGNEARYAVPALRSRKAPEHRYGQTCTRVGSMLLVFGGWNGQQALSDLIAIETQ